MSFRQKIANWIYTPTATTSDPPSTWQTFSNSMGVTNTGIPVNTTTAMRASAVMACVRVLSDTLAQVPLMVYRRVGESGKERATDHPLYDLLHKNPNDHQTSFEWRRLIQGHTVYRGNGYCEIMWEGSNAKELIPLNPDKVKVEDEDGEVVRYEYTNDAGRTKTIRPDNMLHLTGLSKDGAVGLNPIQVAAQTIGITLAADKFGGSFFGDGATASGVLTHPESLSVKAQDNLRDSIKKRIGGDNRNSPLILEEAMTWTQMSVNPDEAQFLETRKFQVGDIARIYRVPPHMIGDLEKATFSNIEQQAIEFVTYSMMPWYVMWEQRLTQSLILDDSDDIFIEFLVDGLLRGDSKARSESLAIQFMNGALSDDEWRAIENRNPLEDDSGKKYYRPLNLVDVTEEPQEKPSEQTTNEQMFESLLFDASSRIARAELRQKLENKFNKPKLEAYANKTLAPFGLHYTDKMLSSGVVEIKQHTQCIFEILKEQRNEL